MQQNQNIPTSREETRDWLAMKLSYLHVAAAIFLGTVAHAQTSGHVGPTTPLSEKQGTICNVLNYGGTVGSSVCP